MPDLYTNLVKQDYRGWVIDKGEWAKFQLLALLQVSISCPLPPNYVIYVTLQGASWLTEADPAWSYFYPGLSFKFSSTIPPLDVPQIL